MSVEIIEGPTLNEVKEKEQKQNGEKKEWKVSEVDDYVSSLKNMKDVIKGLKDQQKDCQKIANEIEAELMEFFETTGKTAHVGTDAKIHVRETLSFKTPKDKEHKEAFFNYLKEKGEDVYWSLATVNSQSLNAFCKAEFDVAKEENVFPFSVAGIEDPTSYKKVILKDL